MRHDETHLAHLVAFSLWMYLADLFPAVSYPNAVQLRTVCTAHGSFCVKKLVLLFGLQIGLSEHRPSTKCLQQASCGFLWAPSGLQSRHFCFQRFSMHCARLLGSLLIEPHPCLQSLRQMNFQYELLAVAHMSELSTYQIGRRMSQFR